MAQVIGIQNSLNAIHADIAALLAANVSKDNTTADCFSTNNPIGLYQISNGSILNRPKNLNGTMFVLRSGEYFSQIYMTEDSSELFWATAAGGTTSGWTQVVTLVQFTALSTELESFKTSTAGSLTALQTNITAEATRATAAETALSNGKQPIAPTDGVLKLALNGGWSNAATAVITAGVNAEMPITAASEAGTTTRTITISEADWTAHAIIELWDEYTGAYIRFDKNNAPAYTCGGVGKDGTLFNWTVNTTTRVVTITQKSGGIVTGTAINSRYWKFVLSGIDAWSALYGVQSEKGLLLFSIQTSAGTPITAHIQNNTANSTIRVSRIEKNTLLIDAGSMGGSNYGTAFCISGAPSGATVSSSTSAEFDTGTALTVSDASVQTGAITFTSGWGGAQCTLRKRGNTAQLTLINCTKPSGVTGNNVQIGTLPQGFYPITNVVMHIDAWNGTPTSGKNSPFLILQSDGVINLYQSGGIDANISAYHGSLTYLI